MKDWFKVFGSSFFSDKNAEKAAQYGFASVVLAILLSFAFFLFGFMAADVVPFSTHYENAAGYKEFVCNAFSDDGLNIEISGDKALCDKKVNTYIDETDNEKYSIGGYDLIIDTRDSDLLTECYQVAIKDGDEIDYAEYITLSNKEKEKYTVKTIYTDKELKLTPEKTAEHESYLDRISAEGSDSFNSEAAAAYKALKERDLSQEDYRKEVYYLYVEYYFTNIESVLMSAKAPVLCDYYYLDYVLNGKENYLYFFDDICIGSFKTDKNISSSFVGYYKGCANGKITVDSAGDIIKDVFYDSVGYSMSSYLTSAIQMAPGYILIPVLIGLILFLVCKASKKRFGQRFSDCYKIVNSFVWITALLTGLLTFVLAFFVFARKLYLFMPLIFAVILIVRTAVFYITRNIKEREFSEQFEQTDTQESVL